MSLGLIRSSSALSSVRRPTLQHPEEAYSCEVKRKVQASKVAVACGAALTDYCLLELTADKRSGPVATFQHEDPKSSLIAASGADELLCILAVIRSDADRRNVRRKQFSNLEKLREDMKSSLSDSDDFSSRLSTWIDAPLHASSCVLV